MTTYMDFCNTIVRRTGEVQMDETNFATVRGVQAVIKDAVIDGLNKIFQTKYKWPFNAVTATQVLAIGDQEYDWPERFQSVDWRSFQIQKDTVLNINSKHLPAIEREEWYDRFRDDDFDAGAAGRNIPRYVFSNHGEGWGVTPSPERAYTIKFKYWQNPILPILFSDVLPIPAEFEPVLTQNCLMHMYLFLDNNERSTIAETRFEKGLKDMVITLLGNNWEHTYDGRVHF